MRVLEPISQVTLAPTNAAAVSAAAPAGARGCFISVATQDVFVSVDGTAATAGNGLRLKAAGGDPFYLPMGKSLSIIGVAAGASDVRIVWVL